MRRLITLSACPAMGTSAAWPAASWTVSSRDGCQVVTVSLKQNPQPYLPGQRAYYQVAYGGVPVLTDSPLGLEYSKGSDLASPGHDVTIPFIQMLAGPVDFAPGGFHNAARGQFKALITEPMTQGTRAHQLAMFVVYESALTVLADYPEAYRNQPGMTFLSQVPTVWDETRVLNGMVGKFITVARKKQRCWYLGAMTDCQPRALTLPLDFLDAVEYEAETYADGADADRVGTSLTIAKRKVRPGDMLHLRLAPGGGWAAVVSPVP